MDVVEVVPSFEQYAFTFGGVAPLMRVTPGTALRLWSDDAFSGVLRAATDLSSTWVVDALTEAGDPSAPLDGEQLGVGAGAVDVGDQQPGGVRADVDARDARHCSCASTQRPTGSSPPARRYA